MPKDFIRQVKNLNFVRSKLQNKPLNLPELYQKAKKG